jgi:hypothetical protein
MRIYLVNDRQVDYQQHTQHPHEWTDEQFIEFAEQDGTVYSIEGFQNQWHSGELFEKDLEQHFIRIL